MIFILLYIYYYYYYHIIITISRLAQKNDTCSLVVVSLDLTQHIYPVLFSVDHLPYNCFKLISVPSPVGGILVVSQNGLIYIDQTSVPGLSLGLNEYFGIEKELSIRGDDPTASLLQRSLQPKNPLYSSRMTNFKYLGVTLDASVSCFLNPDTLLFILKEGDVLIIEMVGNEGDGHGWARKKNGISKFRVAKCGIKTTPPICLCKVGQELNSDGIDRWKNENKGTGYIFVGSRVDDSMLLQYQEFEILDIMEEKEKEEGLPETNALPAATSTTTNPATKEPLDDLYNLSEPTNKSFDGTTTDTTTKEATATTTTTEVESKDIGGGGEDSGSETDFYNINIPFDPAAEAAALTKEKEKEKKENAMKIDEDTLDDGKSTSEKKGKKILFFFFLIKIKN